MAFDDKPAARMSSVSHDCKSTLEQHCSNFTPSGARFCCSHTALTASNTTWPRDGPRRGPESLRCQGPAALRPLPPDALRLPERRCVLAWVRHSQSFVNRARRSVESTRARIMLERRVVARFDWESVSQPALPVGSRCESDVDRRRSAVLRLPPRDQHDLAARAQGQRRHHHAVHRLAVRSRRGHPSRPRRVQRREGAISSRRSC